MSGCPHGKNRHEYEMWFYCSGCNKETKRTGTIKCLWDEDGEKRSRKITCKECDFLCYGWSVLPCDPGEMVEFEDAYVRYRFRNIDR